MIMVTIFLLTFSVLRCGGEAVRLVNLYSSACDTSDSRAIVMQAVGYFTTPDMKELPVYNFTVEQFDTDTVSVYLFSGENEHKDTAITCILYMYHHVDHPWRNRATTDFNDLLLCFDACGRNVSRRVPFTAERDKFTERNSCKLDMLHVEIDITTRIYNYMQLWL